MKDSFKILASAVSLTVLCAMSLQAQTNSAVEAITNAPAPASTDHVNSLLGFAVLNIVPLTIVAAVLILAITRTILTLKYRNRREVLMHETLRAMIEKGTPIPPELLAPPADGFGRRFRSDLRMGVILLGAGAGVAIFGNHTAGGIVLFIGAAFVLAHILEKRFGNRDQNLK